jgi:hypothetical protein
MTNGANQPVANLVQDAVAALDLEHALKVDDFLNPREPPRPRLSLDDRLTLVEEAIKLLDGLYVHLPVKRAIYAVDPVRRLQLLKFRLEHQQREHNANDEQLDDLRFHRELVETFTSIRDLHTMYVLPKPFSNAVAVAPFQIESCFGEEGNRRYILTNVIRGLSWFDCPDDFVPGVEVRLWNDIKIERAVEIVGECNSGSNPVARLARGLARLTIRPLARALPPDEEAVTILYTTLDGKPSTLRIPWRIAVLGNTTDMPLDGAMITGLSEGMDYESDFIRDVRKRLYGSNPNEKNTWARYAHTQQAKCENITAVQNVAVPPEFHGLVEAKTLTLGDKSYGYIRIRSFKVNDGDNGKPQRFIDWVSNTVEAMPEEGLIIDIRDNPGGYIPAGERLLQLFTPSNIEPEPAQFIATPLSAWLCANMLAYDTSLESLEDALQAKTMYSLPIPVTDVDECNNIGQRYYGPVVLITNAICYSASDIFAAGFQDHGIGTVLGIEGSTGAGGAQVIMHTTLFACLKQIKSNPFKALPGGSDLRLAIRRTLRVGANNGKQLEDLGVKPDFLHRMTDEDLLCNNVHLIQAAIKNLNARKGYRLREVKGSVERTGETVCVAIQAQNFVRLDISVDGWQSPSIVVRPECPEFKVCAILPPSGEPRCLELRGYDSGSVLVAVRKIPLSEPVADASPPPH